ncbi:MAG TPA: hypothetical protein VEC06_18170 [Paucimonas sp.]|nr:hypothetical protein [Paucimonas sp.]
MSSSDKPTKQRSEISGHWVDGKPVLPDPTRTRAENNYLQHTTFNISHPSEATFKSRARAFSAFQPAEENLLSSINNGMRKDQPVSAETMQSGWMLHAQRGMFGKSSDLQKAEIGAASEGARSLIAMFQRKEQGPLTLAQSQLGAEVALTSAFMQPKEVQSQFKARRVDASRALDDSGKPSHQSSSKFGMDLSPDLGTQVRDRMGLPVMSGTSGTSSTMTLSHMKASMDSGQSQLFDPSLSAKRGVTSMANLSFQYMRSGQLPELLHGRTRTNLAKQHPEQTLISNATNPTRVQTHTYPEVFSAVDMTLRGKSAKSGPDHVKSNLRAASELMLHMPPRPKL